MGAIATIIFQHGIFIIHINILDYVGTSLRGYICK